MNCDNKEFKEMFIRHMADFIEMMAMGRVTWYSAEIFVRNNYENLLFASESSVYYRYISSPDFYDDAEYKVDHEREFYDSEGDD